jgi:hypothetical protein
MIRKVSMFKMSLFRWFLFMFQLQCHNEPKMVTKWVLLNFVKCWVLKSIDQIFGKKILPDFFQISAKLKTSTMSNFVQLCPTLSNFVLLCPTMSNFEIVKSSWRKTRKFHCFEKKIIDAKYWVSKYCTGIQNN